MFLTGHTGFKGSWLSLWLQKLGANVTGFALEPHTEPSLFVEASVADGMRSIIGDIRNLDRLREAMVVGAPDIVIHMAAQSLVRESYQTPLETYSVNVMGTANVLEVVRSVPQVGAVVIVTTDKCYENREWEWGYREVDHLGGYDPYSSSKACAEIVTAAYRSSFFSPVHRSRRGVAVASARAGNVIGGGDWSNNRLIPDLLSAFSRGEIARIRNPASIRPWQHVLEPLDGYLLLAQRLFEAGGDAYAAAWNFGPVDADARPVEWIADTMVRLWGDAAWTHDIAEHPHEMGYLKLDCSRAKSQLGWAPRWNLATALSAIVNWHRAYVNGENMKVQTLSQVEEFERAAN